MKSTPLQSKHHTARANRKPNREEILAKRKQGREARKLQRNK